MTSNDTPRWESKPPLIPPRARRARVSPPPPRRPTPFPSPVGTARASPSPRHVPPQPLPRAARGGGRRGRGCGYEIASCICSLHLASDYARPITAVKLDCRRLSPADRPNKTRIFSGITAVPAAFLPLPLAPLPPPTDRPTDSRNAVSAARVISILYFMGNDGQRRSISRVRAVRGRRRGTGGGKGRREEEDGSPRALFSGEERGPCTRTREREGINACCLR